MKRDQARQELLAFLTTIARPDRNLEAIDDELNLFDVGLLDSLAVIQIIMHLEQTYGTDIHAAGIDPVELGTIGGILNAIEHGG